MFRSKVSIVSLILFLLISVTVQAEVVSIEATVKSIDAKAHTITVQRKDKTTELDVSRKAKITLLDKDATLESLKAGQEVTLTFHTELEIVLKIEASKEPEKSEVLNLSEFNTSETDMTPWLSSDGLTIYWSAGTFPSDWWIWTASRKDASSLFKDKKRLFRGHSPVVSHDGLELIFNAPDSPKFFATTRDSTEDEFRRPRVIEELRFNKENQSAPRSLSHDGLSLYFDYLDKKHNPKFEIWFTTRKNRNSAWKPAQPVKISTQDALKGLSFTQPFLTDDQLEMYVVVGKESEKPNIRFGILSRKTLDAPFSSIRYIDHQGWQRPVSELPDPTLRPCHAGTIPHLKTSLSV
ncbi:MAG TPA: hypothetical protein DCM07_18900 [Planctomycetaceae bacterium]|uniref:hypothetical protein n=1 Tax=Gimesia sp. TaxID=2024833 RepID=UPI000C3E3D8B|nr:hypothetical protein [Gimesia sp.]MAX35737.1 hypothetical protein [Gimesia sp.]HAH46876.1 hypothetical protein [Planctomycetaceae bacterium]HBL47694.1 hypothetical protein [Planctomycetaceae bacterium]|tara:strand:+ start:9671 stop:10723 length:1053 start_codon:yes stop_codon:yes gene_type:complete